MIANWFSSMCLATILSVKSQGKYNLFFFFSPINSKLEQALGDIFM